MSARLCANTHTHAYIHVRARAQLKYKLYLFILLYELRTMTACPHCNSYNHNKELCFNKKLNLQLRERIM